MIWQWEGDSYQVLLPTEAVSNILRRLGTGRNIFYEPAFNCSGLVLSGESNKLSIKSVLSSGSAITAAAWMADDPSGGVLLMDKTPCPFHIMLKPLDKQGEPIDQLMLGAYPDGSIVEGGYLYRGDIPLEWPISSLPFQDCDPYSLRDTAPDDKDKMLDMPVYRKLQWVFVQGCFVSMQPMFNDNAEGAWKQLYFQD